ncbi:MAG TPA: hypothetical protein VF904_12155 [Anaeromyxobacteraceae bacterium]
MAPRARYNAALVAVLLAVPALARAERVAGALLPDEARQVEPYRYRVEKSYEETLKFFKAVYPPAKFPRRPIVNQPGIKAVHIDNPEARPGGWDGMNVYELKGETRVFVLVAPAEKEKKGRRR